MDTKKITHIVVDEKFIMSAYMQFEEIKPEQNKFCVLVDDLEYEFIHIKPKKSIIKLTKTMILDEMRKLNENNIVVFHSLDPGFFDFIFALNEKVKVILFCFGYEIYGDGYFFLRKKVYTKTTKQVINIGDIKVKNKIKEFFIPFYRRIKPQIPLTNLEIKKNALARVDYMGCSFREEFLNIQKLINQKKQFFNFWYYSLEEMVDIKEPVLEGRNNVLIGNSASATNNHLDSFNFLNKLNFKDYSKVIVPLSYGDPVYGEVVLDRGEKLFGDAFTPLKQFIKYEEYVKIIKSCNVAIIYAKRQKAIGNILALLWYGAKVFLSKDNTFYWYLNRIGIHVYCIENYKNSKRFNLLNEEEVLNNRKVLMQNFTRKKLLNQLNNQIEELL